MIYTAQCLMFLMRADTLHGQVGGVWVLEMEILLGPVKRHRADKRVPFGALGDVQYGICLLLSSI